ncbi:hypothetical protein [Streptomyces sp. NBC_00344]|uniref:hypothetical protein n=1 Tax=Streptomyces sp. NBC_00344 TaxID=2975720 RepID=UPI002E21DC7C
MALFRVGRDGALVNGAAVSTAAVASEGAVAGGGRFAGRVRVTRAAAAQGA